MFLRAQRPGIRHAKWFIGDDKVSARRGRVRLRELSDGLGLGDRAARRLAGGPARSRCRTSGVSVFDHQNDRTRGIPAANPSIRRPFMEITQVKVFPVHEDKLKAYVSIVLDDCFLISDLKVIHGPNGLFISMPSKRKKNGEFKDVAHPLNRETRERMERRILEEYERAVAQQAEEPAGEEVAAGVSPRVSEAHQ